MEQPLPYIHNFYAGFMILVVDPTLETSLPNHNFYIGLKILVVDLALKIFLPKKIRIYGDKNAVKKLIGLENKFPLIWKSSSFVYIPSKY